MEPGRLARQRALHAAGESWGVPVTQFEQWAEQHFKNTSIMRHIAIANYADLTHAGTLQFNYSSRYYRTRWSGLRAAALRQIHCRTIVRPA